MRFEKGGCLLWEGLREEVEFGGIFIYYFSFRMQSFFSKLGLGIKNFWTEVRKKKKKKK